MPCTPHRGCQAEGHINAPPTPTYSQELVQERKPSSVRTLTSTHNNERKDSGDGEVAMVSSRPQLSQQQMKGGPRAYSSPPPLRRPTLRGVRPWVRERQLMAARRQGHGAKIPEGTADVKGPGSSSIIVIRLQRWGPGWKVAPSHCAQLLRVRSHRQKNPGGPARPPHHQPHHFGPPIHRRGKTEPGLQG